MKEIKAIIDAYGSIDFSTSKAALATVARVEGSSYRRTGARMLVLDNGVYLGGISGGCLEGDALRRAQKAIVYGKPSVVTYDTTQDDSHQIGVGLGCNGIIDVLFTPLKPDHKKNIINILSEVAQTREPRIIVSITGANHNNEILGNAILFENDELFNENFPVKEIARSVLGDVKICISKLSSQTNTYKTNDDQIKVFIEIILPVVNLIIYGSNYDIHPMVRIGRELGWDVTVVTNIRKADKSLLSAATTVLDNKGEIAPIVDYYSAIILMAHDYKTDFHNLQVVLNSNASYIGLLGPRKRSEKMLNNLAELGSAVSEKDKARIFAPAGLDIGASNPEEIGLSIAAEIRAHFAGRSGESLRLRKGTIYGN